MAIIQVALFKCWIVLKAKGAAYTNVVHAYKELAIAYIPRRGSKVRRVGHRRLSVRDDTEIYMWEPL